MQLVIEFADGNNERILDGVHVALPVLLIVACIFGQLDRVDPPLQFQLPIDRHEGVGEREDSNDQHDHEHGHTDQTVHDQVDQPAEPLEDPQVEREAQEEHQGGPGLDRPEGGLVQILVDRVVQDECWRRENSQLFGREEVLVRFVPVVQYLKPDLGDLEDQEVDREEV